METLVPTMATVPRDVEELIEGEKHVAQLATCADGKPHVAPIWYRYDDGVIEIATTGQKLANLRCNPQVALAIQVADEGGMPEWHVSLFGTATVIEDHEELRAGRGRIHRKYGIDEDAFPENQLVLIDIGSVSFQAF